MRALRDSSLEEYASWYLLREAQKTRTATPSAMQRDPIAEMQHHEGKMRSWFDASTMWKIVELENVDEFSNLVFLESDWTREEGLVTNDGANYRLLDRVAENALRGGYLHRPSAHRHREYYERLAAGTLILRGEDRIAICSAECSEIAANPAASFYLLDGAGRCLPYMVLLKEKRLNEIAIEAFLAARQKGQ
ncbi:MAG TPA: hypothetical protein VL240_07260 [Candidatus Binatia bacterium]|nr:hypothetical protein [Candidatus Binatia bacterium]